MIKTAIVVYVCLYAQQLHTCQLRAFETVEACQKAMEHYLAPQGNINRCTIVEVEK